MVSVQRAANGGYHYARYENGKRTDMVRSDEILEAGTIELLRANPSALLGEE